MEHPHPQIAVAQGEQRLLGGLHLSQRLRGDGLPGGHPGGQAGVGGLVPGEQPRLFGEGPHLGLADAALPQGRAHGQLPQGPHAGAVPGVVGGVGAVYQHGVAVGLGLLPQPAEQGPLAVVAPVRGVFRHAGDLEHVQLQHGELHPQLGAEPAGVLQLKLGLEGRLDEIGPHLGAMVQGGVQQVGGVHPAGKAQGHFGALLEEISKLHKHPFHKKATGTKPGPLLRAKSASCEMVLIWDKPVLGDGGPLPGAFTSLQEFGPPVKRVEKISAASTFRGKGCYGSTQGEPPHFY